MISRFHYLTQDLEDVSHEQQALDACQAGVKWLQLRMKNKSESERFLIANKVKEICDSFNCQLIINDYVSLAKQIDADGVHLGKSDTTIEAARNSLGNDKIIGGTANTFEDIQKLTNEGADYIGVGPFRFTTTKKNLSHIVGLEGYRDLVSNCKQEEINLPLIAIGGITLKDIQPLMATGIFGFAVSSAINLSNDRKQTVQAFIKSIEETLVLK